MLCVRKRSRSLCVCCELSGVASRMDATSNSAFFSDGACPDSSTVVTNNPAVAIFMHSSSLFDEARNQRLGDLSKYKQRSYLIAKLASFFRPSGRVLSSRPEDKMPQRNIHPLVRHLAAGIFAIAVAAAQTVQPEVPYVPTTNEAVQAMLKLAGVKKTDVVYDLGCGDGRIVITAAKDFGARGVGIDINPQRIKEAEENARKAGVADRVKFIQGDLFQTDIKDASVVTLYLMTHVNRKLRPKLWRDLKPGSRVVSQTFAMGDWKPDKTIETENHTIFVWTITPDLRDKAEQAP